MTVTVRRGTAADARPAADLWVRAREAAAGAGAIPPPVHCADDVRAFFADHVVPDMELWLAELPDGTRAGLAVLDGGWLAQLYVEPSLTGRGVGSALLARARAERPAGLRLWTFQSNTGAQRFYARHGFREL